MSEPIERRAASSTRHVTPGHVIFEAVTPNWPNDLKFAVHEGKQTGILMPDVAITGEKRAEQCRYGRVIACGRAAERGTCRPYDDEHFPLKPGTYITLRINLGWQNGPQESACNTWDIIDHDEHPPWAYAK